MVLPHSILSHPTRSFLIQAPKVRFTLISLTLMVPHPQLIPRFGSVLRVFTLREPPDPTTITGWAYSNLANSSQYLGNFALCSNQGEWTSQSNSVFGAYGQTANPFHCAQNPCGTPICGRIITLTIRGELNLTRSTQLIIILVITSKIFFVSPHHSGTVNGSSSNSLRSSISVP